MPILIAITGGSGSGKSTLAETLVAALPAGAAVLVREDSYYRDAASLPGFDAATFDFDDVAARDHELMVRDLSELKAGRDIVAPLYSFIHHGRAGGQGGDQRLREGALAGAGAPGDGDENGHGGLDRRHGEHAPASRTQADLASRCLLLIEPIA